MKISNFRCVEKQYSLFKAADDLNINGKLVLGKAIGDLSGLRLSYEAYKLSFKDGAKPRVIDGFTPEQRFFLGFGQAWAYNRSPQLERLITQSDPRPLPRFRVNGTVSNMPEFTEAFSCKIGDPMARAENERCRVW